MKVYVCVCENEFDGRQVFGVFSSLDRAQEEMRVELDGYLETNPYHNDDIEWYPGTNCSWGWYDACSSNGFYVYEMDVR